MRISHLLVLPLLMTGNFSPARAQQAATETTQQATPETTRAAFESWAKRADSFATGDFVYGRLGRSPFARYGGVARPLRQIPAPLRQIPATPLKTEELRDIKIVGLHMDRPADSPADETARQLGQFLATPHPLDELRELARHPNSRVRTLALAALFERQDARLLPTIAAAMRDTAPTFSDKPERQISQSEMLYSGIDPRSKPQTVGQIATRMMDFYRERSGWNGRDGAAYQATHHDRSWSASEFKVKLDRASQGTSPPPAESAPALKQVRAEIEALPRAERNWLLLALWEPEDLSSGAATWASEAEVVAAARELGAPQLLRMLERKTVSDDPDLRFRPDDNPFWRRMKLFVLNHATQLLEPTMADALLRAERVDADEFLWVQAAAELQPRRAAPILKAALARLDGQWRSGQRGSLMATLWRLSGEQETEFLLDWFWSQTPDSNVSSVEAPGTFLNGLESAPATPTKRLVARLLEDKRLETLPKALLVPLANLINEWAGQTVFEARPLYGSENANDAEALALKRDFIAKARAVRTLWGN